MKLSKYFIGLLVCLFLANQNVSAGDDFSLLNSAVYPIANLAVRVLAIPAPLGPIISVGLGLFQVFTTILSKFGKEEKKHDEVTKALSKVDLLETQRIIVNAVKTVDTHVLEESEKIIRELTYTIETHDFFEKFRNTLEYLRRMYVDKMKVILNPKVTGVQKNLTVSDMMSYDSKYREKLRSFINEYIKPNAFSPTSASVKLLFDYLLDKERLLAIKEDDCHLEAVHVRIFKTFMYITKTLTEGYVMALSAHVIQYQQEVKAGSLSDAEATKTISEELVTEYKNDMKALIEKTHWALDNASREIRNCGSFEMIQGLTFARLSFAQVIPKILEMRDESHFYYKCYVHPSLVDLDKYEFEECDNHREDIPLNSKLSIFMNLKDWQSPYAYMKSLTSDGVETIFGHSNTGKNYSMKFTTRAYELCHTTFCPAFKKKAIAVSTQPIHAKPGNVITGLRWRVSEDVIYIDIQEGKFIDSITVDPETVVWTESPASENVVYLSSELRNIEMGDFVVNKNHFLTSIKLAQSALRKDLIKVYFGGSNTSDWNNIKPDITAVPTYELKLPEADDPQTADVISKNLITKPPFENAPYYVSFQHSDFKKDFGRTTLPLLDIREVVSNPPTPVSGFGFYHLAAPGTGGFISIKLITAKLNNLINFEQFEKLIEVSSSV